MMTDHLMVDNDLFLGRVDEQERFRRVLDDVLGRTRGRLLPARSGGAPSWSHVVLLHGRGGMGKTTLCKRLRDIAVGSPPDQRFGGKLRIVWLDWEVQRDRDLRLASRESITFEVILEHLRACFRDAELHKEFHRFDAECARLHGLEAHVDQMLSIDSDEGADPYTALRKLGSSGIAQLLRMHLPATASFVSQDDLTESISEVLSMGTEALAHLRNQAAEWLQKRLSTDEYRLFSAPYDSLAFAFAAGLRPGSQSKPLVVFLDTYEIVEAKDTWLRLVMSHSGDRVVWVVSGRDNLVESRGYGGTYFLGYQGEVPAERFRAFPMSEFSLSDITAYFADKVPGRPLSPAQAAAVQHATFGVPLAVKTAAAIWARGATLEAITEGLPERASRDEVVKMMTERFLVHARTDSEHHNDVSYLYSLASMFQPDFDILAALWNHADVRPLLDDLERRYEFVFAYEMHVHEVARDFIREYLLAPVERQRPAFIAANSRAISLLERRLDAAAQELTTLEARVQDERWVGTVLALAWHRLWTNTDAGWKTFELALVPALAYDRQFARVLLNQVNFFSPILSQTHKRQLKSWTMLVTRGVADDDAVLVDALRHSLVGEERQPNQGCATETAAIVAWLRGRVAKHVGNERLSADYLMNAAHQIPNESQVLRKRVGRELTVVGNALAMDRTGEDLAIALYEQAGALDSTESWPWHSLGHVYEGRGALNDAIAAFRKSSEISPKQPQNWSCLGRIYRKLGQDDKAVNAFKQAIDCEGRSEFCASYWDQLGRIYFERRALAEAADALETAASLDPKNHAVWFGLGRVYQKQEKLVEAVKSFRKAAKSQNGELKADALCRIGDISTKRGLRAQAAKAYAHAVAVNPQSERAWHALGHIHQDARRLDDALASFQRAVSLNPQRPEHLSCVARVLVQLGRLEDAVANFLLSVEYEENRKTCGYLWYQVGQVYRRLERPDDAIEAMQQATGADSERLEYWLRLGDICRSSNRTAEAVDAYSKVIELADEETVSSEKLSEIRGFLEDHCA